MNNSLRDHNHTHTTMHTSDNYKKHIVFCCSWFFLLFSIWVRSLLCCWFKPYFFFFDHLIHPQITLKIKFAKHLLQSFRFLDFSLVLKFSEQRTMWDVWSTPVNSELNSNVRHNIRQTWIQTWSLGYMTFSSNTVLSSVFFLYVTASHSSDCLLDAFHNMDDIVCFTGFLVFNARDYTIPFYSVMFCVVRFGLLFPKPI